MGAGKRNIVAAPLALSLAMLGGPCMTVASIITFVAVLKAPAQG